MDSYVLLASPKMSGLAKRICEFQAARAENHDEPVIRPVEVKWRQFPDEWPDTFFEEAKLVKKSHVTFLACLDKPQTLFEQMGVIYQLARMGAKSFKVILPYFPTGTMERIDHEGQIATAHTLSEMLSGMAPAGPGPVPVYIWDIHALPIRHYFGRNVAPMFKSGVSLLKNRLAGQDISIVFPDQGAYKRFKAMFEDETGQMMFPHVICLKERVGKARVVTIGEGDPAGCDAIIVDDLIHSGGTIVECKNALLKAGATSVSAYATHGVMEKDAWKKFVDAGFAKVLITDSCPTADLVQGVEPFEIIGLAPSIAEIILE